MIFVRRWGVTVTDHSEARVEAVAQAIYKAIVYGGGSCDHYRIWGSEYRDHAVKVLAAADEADRVAGVIRVDTRDEALIDRLARVLCEVDQADIPVERRETMEQTGSGDDFRDMVRAVFAELAAGAQPPPEGQP